MPPENRISEHFSSAFGEKHYECLRHRFGKSAERGRQARVVNVSTPDPSRFRTLVKYRLGAVSLESENRALRAALAARKPEILQAFAETVLVTKEQFGEVIQIDAYNDPEYPGDWHVVFIVSNELVTTSYASARIKWRQRLSEVACGMFDGIRLLFKSST